MVDEESADGGFGFGDAGTLDESLGGLVPLAREPDVPLGGTALPPPSGVSGGFKGGGDSGGWAVFVSVGGGALACSDGAGLVGGA